MDAWSLMRGDAFIHFVSGSRRVNIRLGVLLLIPKSPQILPEETSITGVLAPSRPKKLTGGMHKKMKTLYGIDHPEPVVLFR